MSSAQALSATRTISCSGISFGQNPGDANWQARKPSFDALHEIFAAARARRIGPDQKQGVLLDDVDDEDLAPFRDLDRPVESAQDLGQSRVVVHGEKDLHPFKTRRPPPLAYLIASTGTFARPRTLSVTLPWMPPAFP